MWILLPKLCVRNSMRVMDLFLTVSIIYKKELAAISLMHSSPSPIWYVELYDDYHCLVSSLRQNNLNVEKKSTLESAK